MPSYSTCAGKGVGQFPLDNSPRTIPPRILSRTFPPGQFPQYIVHTCIYIYAYTHIYTYTHTHIHIHTYIHSYTHTYTYIYMHTYTCIHIHTYTDIHKYTSVCMYASILCMYVYIYV